MNKPTANSLTTEYMTVKQVAKATNCSVFTVYHWLDNGRVSGIRVGRSRYISIRSLVEYLGEESAKVCGIELPTETEATE